MISLKVMTKKIEPTSESESESDGTETEPTSSVLTKRGEMPTIRTFSLTILVVTIMTMTMVMKMVMINKFVLFIRGQLSFHASHKAKYSLIIHFDQQRSCSSSLQY